MRLLLEIIQSPKGQGQLRHLLTGVCGFLVGRQLIPQETSEMVIGNSESIITGVAALGTALMHWWSWQEKKNRPTQ